MPLSEKSEAYQVDIFSGSSVVRTLAVTTPSVTYSAALQVTDFGAAQSSVTLKIYQMSELVGRGYAATVVV